MCHVFVPNHCDKVGPGRVIRLFTAYGRVVSGKERTRHAAGAVLRVQDIRPADLCRAYPLPLAPLPKSGYPPSTSRPLRLYNKVRQHTG